MKTLITAVMLTVMGTAGFAETPIETANKVITKGKFVTRVGEYTFIMAYKARAYTCTTGGRDEVYCVANPSK
tara:strand:- start:585 stop:800 length:216 start_codon:yes stop_codon:yes gene_type:complete